MAAATRSTSGLSSVDAAGARPAVAAAGHVDADVLLSHRMRAPAARMAPNTEPTVHLKRRRSAEEKLPGPGQYDAGGSFGERAGGKMYYDSKRNAAKSDHDDALLALLSREDEFGLLDILAPGSTAVRSQAPPAVVAKAVAAKAPGPGSYTVETADRAVRTSAPGFKYKRDDLEAPSKHLERKRYWEEKARDAREGYVTTPNYEVLFERPKGGIMLPEPQISKDPRMKTLVEKVQHDRIKPQTIGYYDANPEVTERRPRTAVTMSQEITARKKTEQLKSKPGVVEVLKQKQQEQLAAASFLGPQLQVPWAGPPDRRAVVREKTPGEHDSATDSDDEDLALINEIDDLISSRRSGKKRSKKVTVDPKEQTEAYLRSSLTGVRKSAATVIMTEPKPHEARNAGAKKLTQEEINAEFLSTQVHQDWGSEKAGNLLRLDLPSGRESVKIKRKGLVDVQDFNEPLRKVDEMGPGAHAPDDLLEFGRQAPGVLPFAAAVSRADAVGPKGEKPEAAREREHQLQLEYGEGELIIDKDAAKEYVRKEPAKKFTLYAQDRFVDNGPDDDPALDHMGGSWFEGMAKEASSRPGVVKYETMLGRSEYDLSKALGDDGGNEELILEVKDWKPHFETTRALKWRDADLDPRFASDRSVDGVEDVDELILKPNKEIVMTREPFYVNMSRQTGARDDEDDDRVAYLHGGDGDAPDEIVADYLSGKDKALDKGNRSLSKTKRVRNVDFGKQSDRFSIERIAEVGEFEELVLDQYGRDEFGAAAKGGAIGFSKQIVGSEREADNHRLDKSDEELYLSPKDRTDSRFTKIPTGAQWKGASDAVNAKDVHFGDSEELKIEIESNKVRTGTAKLKGGVSMTKQLSRELGARQSSDKRDIGAPESEEIILSPNENAITKTRLGTSLDWSRNDLPRMLFSDKDPEMKQDLILEPNEGATRRSSKANISMAKQQSRILRSNAAIDELSEELMLSPKPDVNRLSAGPVINMSRQSEEYTKSQLNAALGRDRSEELMLSPNRDVTRNSTGRGVLTMSRQADGIELDRQRMESALGKFFEEELKLSPNHDVTRVSAARVPAISTQADNVVADRAVVERALGKDFEEEVVISPKKVSLIDRNKGLPFATATNTPLPSVIDGVERSEYVILSPKDEAIQPNKRPATSWTKSTGRNEQPKPPLEYLSDELIVSPDYRTQSYDAGKKTPVWKEGPVSPPTHGLYGDSEELILAPSDRGTSRNVDPRGTVSWEREASLDPYVAEAKLNRDFLDDELKLDPNDDHKKNNSHTISWKAPKKESQNTTERKGLNESKESDSNLLNRSVSFVNDGDDGTTAAQDSAKNPKKNSKSASNSGIPPKQPSKPSSKSLPVKNASAGAGTAAVKQSSRADATKSTKETSKSSSTAQRTNKSSIPEKPAKTGITKKRTDIRGAEAVDLPLQSPPLLSAPSPVLRAPPRSNSSVTAASSLNAAAKKKSDAKLPKASAKRVTSKESFSYDPTADLGGDSEDGDDVDMLELLNNLGV